MEVFGLAKLAPLDLIAIILVIIGGLNWGLVGVAGIDLVDLILGSIPILARVVYIVVGLAAIYLAIITPKLSKG